MGGPAASVLLREFISQDQQTEIEAYLRSISSKVEPNFPRGWDLYTNNRSIFGIPGLQAEGHFSINLQPAWYESEWEELQQIEAYFGWLPVKFQEVVNGRQGEKKAP